jgi:CBS domain containing-hemolysin-like protein
MLRYWQLGYIDPGTTSTIFSILAPLFAMLLAFLVFLIRPFVRLFNFVINRFRGSSKQDGKSKP